MATSSGLERFPCGCVGIRLAPQHALFIQTCDQHSGEESDRATLAIRGCPKEGTRLNWTSREVDKIVSSADILMLDGRMFRRLCTLVKDGISWQRVGS